MGINDKSEVPEQENGGGTLYLREGTGPGWELGMGWGGSLQRRKGRVF